MGPRLPMLIRMAPVSDYEVKNLREVEDMANKGGFSDSQEARFPRKDPLTIRFPDLERWVLERRAEGELRETA